MRPPEHGDTGPPGPEDAGSGSSPRPATAAELHNSTTNSAKPNAAASRQCAADTVAGLRRRRAASWRMECLACGCRDPWRPWRPERLSEKQIAAAVAAAGHLRDAGLQPVFDVPTLRELWRAGHHQLVDDLRGGGR
jgi:hypothetical protein